MTMQLQNYLSERTYLNALAPFIQQIGWPSERPDWGRWQEARLRELCEVASAWHPEEELGLYLSDPSHRELWLEIERLLIAQGTPSQWTACWLLVRAEDASRAHEDATKLASGRGSLPDFWGHQIDGYALALVAVGRRALDALPLLLESYPAAAWALARDTPDYAPHQPHQIDVAAILAGLRPAPEEE
jgi:hypothetical protein